MPDLICPKCGAHLRVRITAEVVVTGLAGANGRVRLPPLPALTRYTPSRVETVCNSCGLTADANYDLETDQRVIRVQPKRAKAKASVDPVPP